MSVVSFNTKEKEFLNSNECCRIATCHDNIPHVVPVSYIFENNLFYFATDFKTRKYKNLINNSRIALVVDAYNSVDNKAICVQGRASMINRGKEFIRLYKIFYRNFEWVRIDPWKEGEAAFVEIAPMSKTSWGLV
jgi:nitroimidazol reductase NimA-like FMN-containing flavoprotein (pyridoxamine 5'-phosphate oxidase superfamily)